MKIYDISPTIHEGLAVFPGDVGFQRHISMDFQKGHHLGLSSIQTTMHLGAHADASNHYHKDGQGIEAKDLSIYIGSCQVIHVKTPRGQRILPKDIGGIEITTERILFATNSFPNPDEWNSDFCALSPELINELAKKNVKLVGIDTPSIDPEASKELESHQAIWKNKMSILEGLVLNHVPAGTYQLIALPLKIKGADASPVRAILMQA